MANPPLKSKKYRVRDQSISLFSLEMSSLLPRRLAAWAVEISLLAVSVIAPYSVGVYLETHSQGERVPLNPVLTTLESQTSKTLALPRPDSNRQIPPLTNICWWVALASPMFLTAWQLYILGRTGRTLPKRWFGVRVIMTSGRLPGFRGAIIREGIGKWGLPLGTAYLFWRYSFAFPQLGLLFGLAGVLMAAESGLGIFKNRRSLHDQIAGTIVIDGRRNPRNQRTKRPPSVTVEVQNPALVPISSTNRSLTWTGEETESRSSLWLWMRRHPGTTLLIFALGGMGLILISSVGTQIYLQSQADQRQSQEQQNQAFLLLANQLGETSADPLEKRKSTILVLARLNDTRAVTLLVDLLGQETDPSLIEALQQAIVSAGTKALLPLRKLNQSLANQLQPFSEATLSPEQQLITSRLELTKQAIAKLIPLYSGQLNGANLSSIDLSTTKDSNSFTLSLPQIDLSGLNFRGANLTQANFKGTLFYQVGKDNHSETFDDVVANLTGANLRQADLTGAVLSYVSLNQSNLIQAILNNADLSHAQLNGANLSSGQMSQANLQQASLTKASLTGANLAEANLQQANLQGAHLGQIRAVGANFSGANLEQTNWQGGDLSSINLSEANLQQADLSSTLLKGANLQNAQLQNANFTEANLSTADLRGAKLSGANFQEVTLFIEKNSNSEQFIKAAATTTSGAQVKGVDFSEVRNLGVSQLNFICENGGFHPQCR